MSLEQWHHWFMTRSDNDPEGRERSLERTDPGTTQGFGLSNADGGPSGQPGDNQEPPARIDHFDILGHLGDGAMGRVYKAFDTRLQRNVALKLLRIDDPDVARRFVREAQAQAKVDHDNVCKVFDVGQDAGRSYIALQFLPGEPLTTACKRMSLEEKVRVGAEVADGLHAAHRQGLIHRDVKPGNIMVEEVPRRGWKAWVLDFGLARETSAEGVTLTGVAVGTPQFMAPEQVRGDPERLDRRVDIYSLGATLYAILAGRPIHGGNTPLEILVKAATDDPIAIRKIEPAVPVDLETIVMKCLEREPERRYDSARAVAEDLRRFLDGEPILARPPTVSYRLRRTVARHRGLVAVGALATLVAVTLAGLWWRERAAAQHQAEIAQRFGQKVERAESLLWKEYALPLHDTTQARAAARRRLQEIESEMQRLGRDARGPGHAAVGRGLLALDEPAQAREHLLQAWNGGYRPAEVAFSLGVATGQVYWQERRKLAQIRNREARAARSAELDATLRDPALELLRASRASELDAPEFLDALLAYYSGDRQRGVERARAAFASVPWFYEAKLLEGQIEVAVAGERFQSGEHEEGLAAAHRAIDAYRAAAAIAASDPRPHSGECYVWSSILHEEVWRMGQGNPATFAAVNQACERTRTADPYRLAPLLVLSKAANTWAEHLLATGQDATAIIARAEDAASEAVRLAPDNLDAAISWSWARWQLGKQLGETGQDPTEALTEAMRRAERAVELAPERALAHDTLALAALDLASYDVGMGRDPATTIDRSIEGFQHAIELDPSSVADYVNLAIAYEVKLDHWTSRLGRDPSLLAERAKEALAKALELNPSLYWTHRTRGAILRIQAEHAAATGSDPTELVSDALTSLDNAAASAPNDASTHVNRAKAMLALARYRASVDQSPVDELRLAREAVDAALRINSADADAPSVGCDVELEGARWEVARGTDPSASLARAGARLRASTSGTGSAASGLGRRGEIERIRALWSRRVGKDPLPAIRRGIEAVDAGLAKHPDSADAYFIRGNLRLLQADVLRGGKQADETRRLGVADLEQARRLKPAIATACESLLRQVDEGSQ